MKFAGIDIGSNAVRLLVGDVIEREDHPIIKKLSLIRVPVRLGADVFSKGKISKKKSMHLVKTMEAFKILFEVFEVEAIRACATSAMREATNGEKVVSRVKKSTGINIEVIDGNTEAKLIMSNLWTQDIDPSGNYLYIDVGGGSTEVSVIVDGERLRSKSFPIGTLRSLNGKVRAEVWDELHVWLNDITEVDHSKLMGIGTGGNINRIFKENGNAFGEPLKLEDIQQNRDRIASYSMEDRIRVLRLRPDRADVIIPAADIYVDIMKTAGLSHIRVPKVGLADGIIYGLYRYQRDHDHKGIIEEMA